MDKTFTQKQAADLADDLHSLSKKLEQTSTEIDTLRQTICSQYDQFVANQEFERVMEADLKQTDPLKQLIPKTDDLTDFHRNLNRLYRQKNRHLSSRKLIFSFTTTPPRH